MVLLDIFKTKEKKEKKEIKKVSTVKIATKKEPIKEKKNEKKIESSVIKDVVSKEEKKKNKPTASKIETKSYKASYHVLKCPHISEKATDLVKQNKYVFKVWPKTNKIEIKKMIKNIYNVDVLDVKIINSRRKKKRIGRIMGWKSGFKKAIVKIKKGQKIEILPR